MVQPFFAHFVPRQFDFEPQLFHCKCVGNWEFYLALLNLLSNITYSVRANWIENIQNEDMVWNVVYWFRGTRIKTMEICFDWYGFRVQRGMWIWSSDWLDLNHLSSGTGTCVKLANVCRTIENWQFGLCAKPSFIFRNDFVFLSVENAIILLLYYFWNMDITNMWLIVENYFFVSYDFRQIALIQIQS